MFDVAVTEQVKGAVADSTQLPEDNVAPAGALNVTLPDGGDGNPDDESRTVAVIVAD